MFARTLDVLSAATPIARIIVVSSDLTVHDIARAKGAAPLAETESGLNAAVSQACAWVAAQGGSGVFIVPADLPLIRPADVTAMIDLGTEKACVVIAPDLREEGTNAMLLLPPQAIRPAFGPASFAAHTAQARSCDLPVHVFRSPTISLDLDVPEDLAYYRELAEALGARAV